MRDPDTHITLVTFHSPDMQTETNIKLYKNKARLISNMTI